MVREVAGKAAWGAQVKARFSLLRLRLLTGIALGNSLIILITNCEFGDSFLPLFKSS